MVRSRAETRDKWLYDAEVAMQRSLPRTGRSTHGVIAPNAASWVTIVIEGGMPKAWPTHVDARANEHILLACGGSSHTVAVGEKRNL